VIIVLNGILLSGESHANESGSEVGNVFLNLIAAILDGGMWLLERAVSDGSQEFIDFDFSLTPTPRRSWGARILIAIAVVGFVALVIVTGGAAIAKAAAAKKAMAAVKIVGGGVLKIAGYFASAGGIAVGAIVALAILFGSPQNFRLPMFTVTPERIFGNQIALLDVNFFSPNDLGALQITATDPASGTPLPPYARHYSTVTGGIIPEGITDEDALVDFQRGFIGTWYVPETPGGPLTSRDELVQRSIASQLRDQIGRWYQILRTIALVGLLSVLIYIGIRILMCSVASEKAKYKNMIQDWLVAMCLVFVLHYIMVFAVTITEQISGAIVGNTEVQMIAWESVCPGDSGNCRENIGRHGGVDNNDVRCNNRDCRDIIGALLLHVDGIPRYQTYGLEKREFIFAYDHEEINESNASMFTWTTSFTGMAKIQSQGVEATETATMTSRAAHTIVYGALVFFTFYFLIYYLRRLLYLAFFTVIAPLIALTYPIDKLNDGKAQAFNYWFKEYMFNLLIQPFHAILFFMFIGSVMEFATSNILYTCVVLAFMMPAERLLRRIFGLDSDTSKSMNPAKAMALGAGGAMALGKLLGARRANNKTDKANAGGDGGGHTPDGGARLDGQSGPDLGDGLDASGRPTTETDRLTSDRAGLDEMSRDPNRGSWSDGERQAYDDMVNEHRDASEIEAHEENAARDAAANQDDEMDFDGRQYDLQERMNETDRRLAENRDGEDRVIDAEKEEDLKDEKARIEAEQKALNKEQEKAIKAANRKEAWDNSRFGQRMNAIGAGLETAAEYTGRGVTGVRSGLRKASRGIQRAGIKYPRVGKIGRGAKVLGKGLAGVTVTGAKTLAKEGNAVIGTAARYTLAGGAALTAGAIAGIGSLAFDPGSTLKNAKIAAAAGGAVGLGSAHLASKGVETVKNVGYNAGMGTAKAFTKGGYGKDSEQYQKLKAYDDSRKEGVQASYAKLNSGASEAEVSEIAYNSKLRSERTGVLKSDNPQSAAILNAAHHNEKQKVKDGMDRKQAQEWNDDVVTLAANNNRKELQQRKQNMEEKKDEMIDNVVRKTKEQYRKDGKPVPREHELKDMATQQIENSIEKLGEAALIAPRK